jgi:endo-1,4-beta-xylanase
MLKRSICACLPLFLLPSLALPQVATGVIPGREWPATKFTLDRGLEYTNVDGRSLLLDLYRPQAEYQASASQPAAAPVPVIVWIHGEAGQFTGRYPTPVASMVGNGYAVATIDYRSSAEAGPTQQLEDCRAAIHWLRVNANKYNLDPDNIGAWGISDGGRLAALLGTSAGLDAPDPTTSVRAVVDFSGPAGSKDPKPASYAAKDNAPIMIVHGDLDKIVPLRQSQALDAALRTVGANSTLEVVKGAGHDFKELHQGDSVEKVNNFLDQNLNGGKHVRYWMGKIDPPDDAWVDPIIDEPTGMRYVAFAAPSLGPGRMASYLIYLPPGYDKNPAKRYPVLYYFHGGAGSQRVADIWVQKLDAAIKKGICPPMIAVSVEGLPSGGFLDSPDGKSPIESVVIKDLIPNVDTNYRTIPRRESRGLEGLSMGGSGAFHFGFKYPEMFSMIYGMCAGVSDPNAATKGRARTAYDLANNPFVLAETNLAAIKGRFKILSVVGTDDFTLEVNKAFDARLTGLGIPHTFKIVPHVSHGYKEYYEILDFSFFKTIGTTM